MRPRPSPLTKWKWRTVAEHGARTSEPVPGEDLLSTGSELWSISDCSERSGDNFTNILWATHFTISFHKSTQILQGRNAQLKLNGRPKNIFGQVKWPKLTCFTLSNGILIKERSWIPTILDISAQIKSSTGRWLFLQKKIITYNIRKMLGAGGDQTGGCKWIGDVLF